MKKTLATASGSDLMLQHEINIPGPAAELGVLPQSQLAKDGVLLVDLAIAVSAKPGRVVFSQRAKTVHLFSSPSAVGRRGSEG